MDVIFFFVFVYPLFMSMFWMIGSLTYCFRREHQRVEYPEGFHFPPVAIVIPCHNEERCIGQTLRHLSGNHYPNLEIIVVDDGSTDGTVKRVTTLQPEMPSLRLIEVAQNRGKAVALSIAAKSTSAEYLMCVDADSLLDHSALYWMIWHFVTGTRVGAVTGNPRIINRDSLVSRIQIGEYASIIGMIKRSQRNLGRLFTVSGVDVCYRKAAIEQAGYWSAETVTEDVDMSWKLQLDYWDIRYEPNALSWILVPDSVASLWRQRLRWARGGIEAALRYGKLMLRWNSRRMWTVYVEYWLGVLWAFAFLVNLVSWAGTKLLGPEYWPGIMSVQDMLPGWTGVILASACLMQFITGLAIDRRYERVGIFRYLYWAIWYPALYWLINAATTVVAVATVLVYRDNGHRTGTWKSPLRHADALAHWRETPGNNVTQNPGLARIVAEVVVTSVFWGMWAHLMAPLLSLLLWLGGIYLFTDRMIDMGGYQALLDNIAGYTIVVVVMSVILAAWIAWNVFRYGHHDRRQVLIRGAGSESWQAVRQDIAAELDTRRRVRVSAEANGEIERVFENKEGMIQATDTGLPDQ